MESREISHLKIAMLGQKRIPSREGGIEVVVEELCTRMVKLGNEVTCFNRKGHHVCGKEFDSNQMSEYKGIKLKSVLTINIRGLAAFSASVFAGIKAAFGKYDIVHFHAEGSCIMLWLSKCMGKRCVVTIHGLDHQRAKWGKFARAFILWNEKAAVHFADEIIVLSESAGKYFKERYNRETKYIPNGVSKPVIREIKLIKESFGLEKNNYILYLGRLVPEKGLQYLVEAFKKINTHIKLVIAGGSSDSEKFLNELREMAEDDERIIFTGFVQGQILEELYSNAYVYVLPSDLEGMPLSLLEAMSYGNCCLVSDIEECTGVVEDKAIVFRKSDAGELCRKLEMLCENQAMVERYKAESIDYICKKFNWDSVVCRTLDLYE